MIRARLIVRYQHDKDANDDPRIEDWGEFDFAELPRGGDHIQVIYDGDNQSVIAQYVRHFAVQHPLPPTEFPSLQRKEPAQHIVADWHWAD